jgi:GTPase SAR1 family protein
MSESCPTKPSYDHFIKMIIIGNSGVGKTNILLRFCD